MRPPMNSFLVCLAIFTASVATYLALRLDTRRSVSPCVEDLYEEFFYPREDLAPFEHKAGRPLAIIPRTPLYTYRVSLSPEREYEVAKRIHPSILDRPFYDN